MDKKPVNLFWTGGWDSTFRLIQLVLLLKKVVQPYYLIDHFRKSTLFEIRAIAAIKNALIEKDRRIERLILPTIFKAVNDIPPDREIAQSYRRLKKVESIGSQYEWLAYFCADEQINDMEISNETALLDEDNRTRRLLGDDLEKITTDYGIYYRLNKKSKNRDLYHIYGHYHFSIFDFTKLDMVRLSREKKFDDVMKLTWFCHTPTRGKKPCGKCKPCKVVYREGLKWRLPAAARFRYLTSRP